MVSFEVGVIGWERAWVLEWREMTRDRSVVWMREVGVLSC